MTRSHRLDFETDTAAVEIKVNMTGLRAMREALVQLVKYLAHGEREEGQEAYLLLVDPRVTKKSLEDELKEFTAALQPELADRLNLVLVRDGKVEDVSHRLSQSDLAAIKKHVERIEADAASTPVFPRRDKQSEVLLVLLHQWVQEQGPMTFDWIGRTVGCSYRTVATMVDKLGPSVERLEDRRIALRRFPSAAWARFIAVSNDARGTIDYVDTSGQPRSAESLVRRLRKLDRSDIAVGGVFGARRYYPEVDIVSAPRLDLSMHVPEGQPDLGFMEKIDPALDRADSRVHQTRVAIHFVRRAESFFTFDDDGGVWADPVECLADLYEAALEPQASQLRAYLTDRRRAASGQD